MYWPHWFMYQNYKVLSEVTNYLTGRIIRITENRCDYKIKMLKNQG